MADESTFTRVGTFSAEAYRNRSMNDFLLQFPQNFWELWWVHGSLILLVLFIVAVFIFKYYDRLRRQTSLLKMQLQTQAIQLQEARSRYEEESAFRRSAEEDLAENAADELQQSEARFKAMFDNAAIGIALFGVDRYPLAVNAALLNMTGGYTREEMLQLSGAEITHPEDREIGKEEYLSLLAGERDSFKIEKRYVRKDGEAFWVRISTSCVRQPNGKPQYLVSMIEDINERKQVSIELKESESLFRSLFDHAEVGIVLTNIQQITDLENDENFFRIIQQQRCNPALQQMFGYTEQELLAMDLTLLIYPEDRGLDKQYAKELYGGQRDEYRIEKRYVRRDGSVFLGRLTNSVVRGSNGEPRMAIGILEDISEERQAQAELARSEARFRAILDNTSVGIALLNLDRQPVQINQATMQIMGYSEEELLAGRSIDLAVEEDRFVDEDLFLRLLKGEIDQYMTEKRYKRKNGQVFWGRVIYSSVKDTLGKPQYLINLIEDIDHEKKAKEELRQSEARFRAMFDNTSIGMALMGLDRKALQVNQTAQHILGYSREELLSVPSNVFVVEADRNLDLEQFNQLAAGEIDQFQAEKRFRRKDGRIFWGRVAYSSVRSDAGKPQYLIGLIEDIDDEKGAQERLAVQEAEYRRMLEQRVAERTRELSQTNERLEQEIAQRQRAEQALASKAVEEAVTGERNRLARELHDAVTQTLFSASLIAEVLPDLWALDLHEARESTEELRQLTRGALAEMRTLLLELRPAVLTQTRFEDLLRQLCEALIGRARLPIKMEMRGQRQLPPEVQVALYRIAQESLNNIVKYARPTQVWVDLQMKTDGVHMAIRDNGVGFDTSLVKPATLGQRIMRERAENIGAELTITSQPGKGTEVAVIWQEDAAALE